MRPHILLIALLSPIPLAAQPAATRDVPELARLSRDLRVLGERVAPAVVQILTTGYVPSEGGLVLQRATGSGVILDPDGYLVTNAHVVEGARRVQVALLGRCRRPARSALGAEGAGTGVGRGGGGDGPGDRPGRAQGRRDRPPLPAAGRLRDAAARRAGPGLRQPARPRELGDHGRGERRGAAGPAGRPDDLRPDRRLHQPRQQRRARWWTARGRVVGINTFIFSQSGRQRRHRLRGAQQHRAQRVRADPQDGARPPGRDRRARPDAHAGAGGGPGTEAGLGRGAGGRHAGRSGRPGRPRHRRRGDAGWTAR